MTAAAADSEGNDRARQRKKTLFESLFSSSPERQNRKRPPLGRKWLENNPDWQAGDDTGVRIINGQDISSKRRNRNVVVVDSNDEDPEGDPGIGMGNLPYVPPKLASLSGIRLSGPRPVADMAAGAVFDTLAGNGPALGVLPEIRDAVLAQYQHQQFRPVWLKDGRMSERGNALLKLLSAAGEEGLTPESYLPPVLSSFGAPLPENDPAAMARLDIDLTAAAVQYARDASGGQFDPRKLSLYNDVTPPWVPAAQAVKVIAWSPYPSDYLMSLHPRHPAYAAMKKALAEARGKAAEPEGAEIADGDIVKKGKSDERIPAVRRRLADLGYTAALDAAGEPETLDADLSVQLRLFQKERGIKVTGVLGPQTVQALNTNASGNVEAKLLDNMERLRWLPRSLGHRYVFVNQAAFKVQVMDRGQPVWESRVIVGKPMTQTAVFNDEMEMVVFNPSWGIPQSIIANEYLPKLRRDPGYLDRIGFKVVDSRGKQVSSRAVDWGSYGSKVPFGIQQPPGAKNALGEIKFLFPNSHDIYMHDTPNRELFANDVRAFSHGCVRVQNPRDFASVLLGWDREKVDANIESKESETVRLKEKVPVHLTYFTAWPDENGRMHYYGDIYARDKTMETARSAIVLAQR